MNYRCPYCRESVAVSDTPHTHCPNCSRYIGWLGRSTDFVIHDCDLRRLGRGQRMLNTLLLAVWSMYAVHRWGDVPPRGWGDTLVVQWVFPGLVLLMLLAHIGLAAGIQEVQAGFSADGKAGWLLPLFLSLPPINAVLIVILNFFIARAFGRIGLPWRLFGWLEQQLTVAFEQAFCRKCGYNVRGNVSGRCPECGTETGLKPDRVTGVSE